MRTGFNYDEALRLSWKFYKAQRSGRLPDNDIPWRAHSAAHTGSLVLVLRPGTPADRCAWCRCGASCPLGTDIVGGDEHRPCGGAAVRVAHTFVNGELFADPLPVCATHLPALRAYVEQLPGKSDR